MTTNNPTLVRRPWNWATLWRTVIAFLFFLNLIGQAYTGYDTYQRNKLADDRAPAYSTRADEAKKLIALPGRDCWPDASGTPVCGI
jgi:hypothetical protein